MLPLGFVLRLGNNFWEIIRVKTWEIIWEIKKGDGFVTSLDTI